MTGHQRPGHQVDGIRQSHVERLEPAAAFEQQVPHRGSPGQPRQQYRQAAAAETQEEAEQPASEPSSRAGEDRATNAHAAVCVEQERADSSRSGIAPAILPGDPRNSVAGLTPDPSIPVPKAPTFCGWTESSMAISRRWADRLDLGGRVRIMKIAKLSTSPKKNVNPSGFTLGAPFPVLLYTSTE